MINMQVLAAFADELEQIEAEAFIKEAGFGSMAAKVLDKTRALRSKLPFVKKPNMVDGIRTNLVGATHDLLHPIKSTKKAWKDSKWMGDGDMFKATKHLPVGMKSLTVGGAAATAPEAFSKDDKTGKGRSRAERIGGWAAGTVGGLATMNRGLSGGIAGTLAAERAGAAAGRLLSKRKSQEST